MNLHNAEFIPFYYMSQALFRQAAGFLVFNENTIKNTFNEGCSYMSMKEDFKKFAMRGNVMDMAVGVLIGGAFSGIVTSLTDNFIQPIIKLVMTGKVYTLEEISGYASAFGSSVVNFLIMAFILFCLLKAMNKVMSFGSKPEEPAQPTTKICPFCMSEIDIRATRCPHCTSVQPESEADQK